jgi:hypothetical protein
MEHPHTSATVTQAETNWQKASTQVDLLAGPLIQQPIDSCLPTWTNK